MSVSTLASFGYLERLPGATFLKLYQQPSTALAIFRRMLPHLAKTFVMALLYMNEPLPLSDLDLWVQTRSKKARDAALSAMSRLYIARITSTTKEKPQTIALTRNFRSSLRLALTGGGDHQSFGVPSSDTLTEGVDTTFLDSFATAKWEGILNYIVNSGYGVQYGGGAPDPYMVSLLERGNLVEKGRHSGSSITKLGFAFLLQEVNAQVWTLLLLWIKHVEEMDSALNSVEALSFLFMLGSLELGRIYDNETLTVGQKVMVGQLADFGLVYVPRSVLTQFYPTRLATTLTSDSSALRSVSAGFDAATAAEPSEKGFIIVETNYRIYAYTNSPLQITVLSLFTTVKTRYPNMVSAKISRESVAKAISHGITSDQIITYLSTHAHPQLAKKADAIGGPVLPPTVVDQIRLWQLENERMAATGGFLFKDFETQKEYEDCAKYAEEVGVLKWQSNAKRMFFVTRHEQLREFIKSRKAK